MERDSRSKTTHDLFPKTKIKEKGKMKVKDTEKYDAEGKKGRVFVLASIISAFCLDLRSKRIVKA